MRTVTRLLLCLTCLTAGVFADDLDTPVGERPTKATTSDGKYISWREHIIDDPIIGDPAVNGGDGLVIVDLDRDGHLDVVSNHESDTRYDGVPDGHIRVAYGSDNPDRWVLGTLVEGRDAGAPEDVAVADINGDGHPDVMGACELAHLVYLQNPGDGSRKTPWKRLVLPLTRNRGSWLRVFLADFDGDGRPEAVAPNKGAQSPRADDMTPRAISIFQVKGDPLSGDSWTEHELGRYLIPQNSHPVDLDGDGDIDVVGGSRGEQRIMWFENAGESDFAFKERKIALSAGRAGGFNLSFNDINLDNRIDIVGTVGQYLCWLEQPAEHTGIWTVHRIGTVQPDAMVGFTLADIDGDGDLDAIGGSYSRGPRDEDGDVTREHPLGRLAWFEQPDDAKQLWVRHDISRRKRGMFDQFVAQDMDGDNDMDFISTRGNSGRYDGVFWLEQVRTVQPRPAFQRARASDSQEMPLPVKDEEQ